MAERQPIGAVEKKRVICFGVMESVLDVREPPGDLFAGPRIGRIASVKRARQDVYFGLQRQSRQAANHETDYEERGSEADPPQQSFLAIHLVRWRDERPERKCSRQRAGPPP